MSRGSLLLIAVDRFIAVLFPYKYQQLMSHKRVFIATGILWTYMAGMMIVNTFFENYRPDVVCVIDAIWNPTMLAVTMTGVPIATLILCYLLYIPIFVVAHKQRKKIANASFLPREIIMQLKAEQKIAVTSFKILGVFTLCILPMTITKYFADKKPPAWRQHINFLVVQFLFLKAALNPIVYASTNRTLRLSIKKMITGNVQSIEVQP